MSIFRGFKNFSENNLRKIWLVQKIVVPLHSLSEKMKVLNLLVVKALRKSSLTRFT